MTAQMCPKTRISALLFFMTVFGLSLLNPVLAADDEEETYNISLVQTAEVDKEIVTVDDKKVFDLSVDHLGAFYRGRFPSVLFLKLKESNELISLAKNIDELSNAVGFPKETRSFKAHITLARIKFIEDLDLFNDILQTEAEQTFSVDSFRLYESRLTQKGALYSVIERFDFNE